MGQKQPKNRVILSLYRSKIETKNKRISKLEKEVMNLREQV